MTNDSLTPLSADTIDHFTVAQAWHSKRLRRCIASTCVFGLLAFAGAGATGDTHHPIWALVALLACAGLVYSLTGAFFHQKWAAAYEQAALSNWLLENRAGSPFRQEP